MGCDSTDNELGVLELIQLFVEILDKYFSGANELNIMYSLDRVHVLLDEMIMNGDVIETNSANLLSSLAVIDNYFKQDS